MFSTPGARDVFVNYDLGYYAQDSWTLKRLTLNIGLRVDNFRSMYEESANPPGRFVPGRFFPERRNIPNWNNDLAPRLSGAYDLFGNGRTALKASWSKSSSGSRAGSPTRTRQACRPKPGTGSIAT